SCKTTGTQTTRELTFSRCHLLKVTLPMIVGPTESMVGAERLFDRDDRAVDPKGAQFDARGHVRVGEMLWVVEIVVRALGLLEELVEFIQFQLYDDDVRSRRGARAGRARGQLGARSEARETYPRSRFFWLFLGIHHDSER